jgi:hypothetical protein
MGISKEIKPVSSMYGGKPDKKQLPDDIWGAITAMNTATDEAVAERKKYLANLTYAFPDYIAEGNITIIIAPPNAGKTLHIMALLEGQRRTGRDMSQFVYVNEDDNANGAAVKAEMLTKAGMLVLESAAGEDHYRRPEDLFDILDKLVEMGEAAGKVFILDTLKKFIEVMNKGGKDSVKNYMTRLRRFVQSGGTIIALGHANKNPEKETGRPVFAGVQDIEDDCDQMFFMMPQTERTESEQFVKIERGKNRYPSHETFAFRYTKAPTYPELVNNVEFIYDAVEVDERVHALRRKQTAEKFMSENAEALEYIQKAIEQGKGEAKRSTLAREAGRLSPKIDAKDNSRLAARRLTQSDAAKLIGKLEKLEFLVIEQVGKGSVYRFNASWRAESAPWHLIN